MSKEPLVRCNSCMSVYKEEELTIVTEEIEGAVEAFTGCSKCETDAYLMDLEDGE